MRGVGGTRGQRFQESLGRRNVSKWKSRCFEDQRCLQSPGAMRCGCVSCRGWPNCNSAAETKVRRETCATHDGLLSKRAGRGLEATLSRVRQLLMLGVVVRKGTSHDSRAGLKLAGDPVRKLRSTDTCNLNFAGILLYVTCRFLPRSAYRRVLVPAHFINALISYSTAASAQYPCRILAPVYHPLANVSSGRIRKMSSDIESFTTHLQSSKRILALLGAGLSASSGLPTFRGAGGLWRTHDAISLATPEAFSRDPALVWQFYSYRRHMALKASPNRAHFALAELAKKHPGFIALSQNVDGKSASCYYLLLD